MDTIANKATRKLTGTVGKIINNIFDYISNLILKIDSASTPTPPPFINIEEKKFETLEEYINNHVNIESDKNQVYQLLNTCSCEEFIKWVKTYLDDLKQEIAGYIAPLDEFLDKIKRRSAVLGFVEDLLSGEISLSTILKLIRGILEAMLMAFCGPIIDIADMLYKNYRELKIMVGQKLVVLSALSETKLLSKCKYDKSCSLAGKALGINGCPVKLITSTLNQLTELLITTVDTATLPVDVALDSVNTLINNDIIRQICPRTYYKVTVRDVIDLIEQKSLYGSNVGISPLRTIRTSPSSLGSKIASTITDIKDQITSGLISDTGINEPLIPGCEAEILQMDSIDSILGDKLKNINSMDDLVNFVGSKSSESVESSSKSVTVNDLIDELNSCKRSGKLDYVISIYKDGKLDGLIQLLQSGRINYSPTTQVQIDENKKLLWNEFNNLDLTVKSRLLIEYYKGNFDKLRSIIESLSMSGGSDIRTAINSCIVWLQSQKP